jgi:hypothetical protein
MTEMMSRVTDAEDTNPPVLTPGLDEQLIAQLAELAKAGGLQLTGDGGVWQQLTKHLLEYALDGEITDYLGWGTRIPTPLRRTCTPTLRPRGPEASPCTAHPSTRISRSARGASSA